jgi:hypothetical protein
MECAEKDLLQVAYEAYMLIYEKHQKFINQRGMDAVLKTLFFGNVPLMVQLKFCNMIFKNTPQYITQEAAIKIADLLSSEFYQFNSDFIKLKNELLRFLPLKKI